MNFQLKSDYCPTGDQPQAIDKLTAGTKAGMDTQVLLGVTGSGKTFTIANVIANTQKPTLVISHNKTLATQLYQEFKEYFPQNAVSYFVSYYDYYQPEAYVPQTDTYISKETDINTEIDQLRLLATSHIFSRKDVIVVASVSCIYNIGSPESYRKRIIEIKKEARVKKEDIMCSLVAMQYLRSRLEFARGNFRLRGDQLELYPSYAEEIVKIIWDGDTVSRITTRDVYGEKEVDLDYVFIFPAKHYLADKEVMDQAFRDIREDLRQYRSTLEKSGKLLEANRIDQRVNYDLEMLKEVGYVNGVENYSRYFDGRCHGDPPDTLINYLRHQYGDDFLVVIDESHMTLPQIRGMYRGDQSRKQTLVDFGFRLPSALDNRPLKLEEFLPLVSQMICVSATPNEWEVNRAITSARALNTPKDTTRLSQNTKCKTQSTLSHSGVVEQLIRPTGLVDPVVEVRPTKGQIIDLAKEILARKKQGERVLVTTLTKKMAEDLSTYLADPKNTGETILVHYLHADVDTLERSDIIADLRLGNYDAIVGINLLREGLDLPEVSLVAILDADRQGFLRSKTALVQTMGRAARHVSGKVILYADEVSEAMRGAMTEVERRRSIQLDYNQQHNIIPQTIVKPVRDRIIAKKEEKEDQHIPPESLTPGEARKLIPRMKREMRCFARMLDFEKAARKRDEIAALQKRFDLWN